MQPLDEKALAAARRSLWFYRLALLICLGLLGYAAWRQTRQAEPSGAGPAGETWSLDLAERIDWVQQHRSKLTDYSQPFFVHPAFSVHMHYMAPHQSTPLHVHTEGQEVVVLVNGPAEVEHVVSGPAGPALERRRYPAGSVLGAPPRCAHAWYNPSPDRHLANLVFAAPLFNGNLYVQPGDDRLDPEATPFSWRPDEPLAELARSADAYRRIPLGPAGGAASALLVRTRLALAPNPGKPVMLYVLAGRGSLHASSESALRPRVLVHLEHDGRAVIQAEPGSALALLAFDPLGGLELEPAPAAAP